MVTFGSRLISLVASALLLGLAEPAMSQDVFHGNDNNSDDQRQQSGLPGPGDDNGLFLRRPRGLYYCPRDHGYYRDSRTCGRLEGQDLQPPPAVADDAALVSTCGTILHQNGNFRNSISCKSGRVTGFCEKFGASDPECPAIIAQLRREVPNLGGLSYDGARPISPCRHDPRSVDCKGGTRPTTHPPSYGAKTLTRTPLGQISPDQPATLPIGFENIAQGIDVCFKKHLPRYKHPDWALLPKYQLDPISEKMTPSSLFYVAQMAADEALPLLKPNDVGRAQELDLDYLTGWVIGCLWEREVLPPRDLRREFIDWNRAVHPRETWYSFNERENRYRLGTVERTLRPFATH